LTVTAIFTGEEISGVTGRDQLQGFDKLLKRMVRHQVSAVPAGRGSATRHLQTLSSGRVADIPPTVAGSSKHRPPIRFGDADDAHGDVVSVGLGGHATNL
jgi:hypothetical protein